MKFATIALCFSFLVTPALAADQVYKWTDESGTTHFSASPPDGAEAERMKLDKPPPPPAAEEAAESTPAGDKAASCAQAQQNLETLKANTTVDVQEADGTRRTLSTAERAEMLASEQGRVDMFCSEGEDPE